MPDARRYKGGAWQTGASIQAVGSEFKHWRLRIAPSEHAGNYVRLVGIDPKQNVAY
jgi:carbon dioxide concentrating mechanism protein CcmM